MKKRKNFLIFGISALLSMVVSACDSVTSDTSVAPSVSDPTSVESVGTSVEEPVSTSVEVPTSTSVEVPTSTSVEESVSVHTHVFGAWELTQEPTEDAPGKAERSCECGEKEEVVVPALTDTSVWSVEVTEATCDAPGSKVYTSDDFGTVTVTIEALTHNYGAWVITTSPTETAPGKAERTCTHANCEHKESVVLPNLLDTSVWTMTSSTTPSCMVDGSKTYTSAYGEVVLTISATGHTYGAWQITKQPTATESGTAVRTCACGDTDSVTVPALSDTSVWTEVVAERQEPSCESAGSAKYTSVYGDVVVTLAPTGHTASGTLTVVETDTTVALKQTCTADGEAFGDPVVSKDKVQIAAYTVSHEAMLDGSGVPDYLEWTYDDATGVWTSGNSGQDDSESTLVFTITADGILPIHWTTSGEGNSYNVFDYFKITKNGTDILNCKTNKVAVGDGDLQLNAVAGDVFKFTFIKDGSTASGDDCATIKLNGINPTYGYVMFNSMDGSNVAPMFTIDGALDGELPVPVKEGWYFDGWYTDASLETPMSTTEITSGTTAYAKWVAPAVLTMDLGYDSLTSTVAVKPGDTPTVADPTRDGYHFLGWFEDSTFETPYEVGALAESKTIYAKWISEADTHELFGVWKGFTVTESSVSSTGREDMTVEPSGAFSIRTAYSSYATGTIASVEGGVVDLGAITNGNSVNQSAYLNADKTVMVVFNSSSNYVYVKNSDYINKSTVSSTFVASAGMRFVSFAVGETTHTIMIDHTNKVATFGVSLVDSNGNDLGFSSAAYAGGSLTGSPEGAITLFVKNSEGVVVRKFGYSTASSKMVELTDEQARIAGVYTASDGSKLNVSGADSFAFTNLKSSYSDTYYVGKFQVKDGDVLWGEYSSSYRYIFTLNVADKTFTYADHTCDVVFDFGYKASETDEANVTATFTGLYGVTKWISSSGLGSENSHIYEPTREGYVFVGWYTQPQGSEEAGTKVSSIVPGTHTTVYAHWNKLHTVSFSEADGTPIAGCDAVTVENGKKVSSMPTPEKEGVFFDGWYTDTTLETPFNADATVTEDMTLYAKWTAPITVTMHLNNGAAEPVVVSAQVNRVPDLPNPTWDSEHYFDGWYTDATLETPFDASQPLTESVTLYAKWGEAPAFVGNYVGYNCYGSNNPNVNKTTNSQYNATINPDGSATFKNTSYTIDFASCSGNTIVVEGKSANKVLYKLVADDGRTFLLSYYSLTAEGSDPLSSGDYAFYVQVASGETVVIRQSTIVDKHFLVYVAVGDAEYVIYINKDASVAVINPVMTTMVDGVATPVEYWQVFNKGEDFSSTSYTVLDSLTITVDAETSFSYNKSGSTSYSKAA